MMSHLRGGPRIAFGFMRDEGESCGPGSYFGEGYCAYRGRTTTFPLYGDIHPVTRHAAGAPEFKGPAWRKVHRILDRAGGVKVANESHRYSAIYPSCMLDRIAMAAPTYASVEMTECLDVRRRSPSQDPATPPPLGHLFGEHVPNLCIGQLVQLSMGWRFMEPRRAGDALFTSVVAPASMGPGAWNLAERIVITHRDEYARVLFTILQAYAAARDSKQDRWLVGRGGEEPCEEEVAACRALSSYIPLRAGGTCEGYARWMSRLTAPT